MPASPRDRRGPPAQHQRHPKIAEWVAQAICEFISRHHLTAGDSLPNEREMVEMFGVGRYSVREALRLLETQQVISIRVGLGGGPVVQRPSPGGLAASLSLVLQFMAVPFKEVIRARELLEPQILSEATVHASTDDLGVLQASADRMHSVLADHHAFLLEDEFFHDSLTMLTKNAALQVIAESLEEVIAGLDLVIRYSVETRKDILAAHQRIIDALAAGDPEEAARQGAAHVAEFRHFLERQHSKLLDQSVRWTRIPAGKGGTLRSPRSGLSM